MLVPYAVYDLHDVKVDEPEPGFEPRFSPFRSLAQVIDEHCCMRPFPESLPTIMPSRARSFLICPSEMRDAFTSSGACLEA